MNYLLCLCSSVPAQIVYRTTVRFAVTTSCSKDTQKVFHVSAFFMPPRVMCNELCVHVNAAFMLCQLRVRVSTYTELDSVPTKYYGSETIDETSGQRYRPINE